MNTIQVKRKAANIDELDLTLFGVPRPEAADGECVIEVASAGVNPSDVKATLGLMPHAVWPRTPGRDYAGVVIDGPAALMGQQVWGSGGELGIRRDGTHGKYLRVNAQSVRAKPATLSLLEAGAVGVPFITAYEGLRRAGMPRQAAWCWSAVETARWGRPRSRSPRRSARVSSPSSVAPSRIAATQADRYA
jgi:NADPH:quinone reductase-like Zn-dependent oxidoreductase